MELLISLLKKGVKNREGVVMFDQTTPEPVHKSP